MVATVLVVSDLHLTDGDLVLESWREPQQAAFNAMLAATYPGGSLASETVELIINGDCFDFLLSQPMLGQRTHTDVTLAHAKWTGIVAAHAPWFGALHDFLQIPGRRLTFTIGNHDLELVYPSIRARVRSALNAPAGTVRFCLGRAYRPLPDVLVEHGCQFDFFNFIPDIWERPEPPHLPSQLEVGEVRSKPIGPAQLPWGSRYYYHVFLPIKRRFPYMDQMLPDLGVLRQLALLTVLEPQLLRINGPLAADLLPLGDDVRAAYAEADPGDPVSLLLASIKASGIVLSAVRGGGESDVPDEALIAEISSLLAAVAEPRDVALERILTPVTFDPTAHDADLAGQRALLEQDSGARYSIIGHTHVEGRWPGPTGKTVLNTGTWVPRHATPRPAEWSTAYAAWYEHSDTSPDPSRDASRFTIAWLRSEPGAATTAELIAWQGDDFVPVPDDAVPALLDTASPKANR